jgi:hypothetical protein
MCLFVSRILDHDSFILGKLLKSPIAASSYIKWGNTSQISQICAKNKMATNVNPKMCNYDKLSRQQANGVGQPQV